MSISSFIYALVTAALAVTMVCLGHEVVALVLAPAVMWFAYTTFAVDESEQQKYVLELGGVRWSEADFCRGWEIDGRTGSGNPLVMEKAQVDAEVMRLNRLRSQHSEALFITRNSIRRAQEDIPRLEQKITNIQADLGIRQNTKGDAFTITIETRFYQNREEACAALNRLAAKHHLSARVVDVGEFAGFTLQLWPERVKEIVLRGKNAYVANISDASLGTISSLEHVVRSFDERLNECRNNLTVTQRRLEELLPHAHKPFDHEEKLKGLIQRQQEIVQALDLTKNQASNSLAAEPTAVLEESVHEGQLITRANKEKLKLKV